MNSLSFDTLYNQVRLGFDLAAQWLTTPVMILFLVGGLFVVWRLLTPHK